MKYIYSTSQMSKLSLTLHTFSVTGSVAGLFLIGVKVWKTEVEKKKKLKRKEIFKSRKIDKRKRKMLVSKHTITQHKDCLLGFVKVNLVSFLLYSYLNSSRGYSMIVMCNGYICHKKWWKHDNHRFIICIIFSVTLLQELQKDR